MYPFQLNCLSDSNKGLNAADVQRIVRSKEPIPVALGLQAPIAADKSAFVVLCYDDRELDDLPGCAFIVYEFAANNAQGRELFRGQVRGEISQLELAGSHKFFSGYSEKLGTFMFHCTYAHGLRAADQGALSPA